MIESTYISKSKETGIYYIEVYISNDIPYCINSEKGDLNISFYYDVEYMPGMFDEEETSETIHVGDPFDSEKYLITHTSKSNKIIIMCIPKLLVKEFFEEV